MPQGRRERQPKNLSVLFLDRSHGPDTTEPWSEATTVIWRIPLVFVAQEVPFTGNVTWASEDKDQRGAVVASVMELYSWQLSVDTSLLTPYTWPLEAHAAFWEGMISGKHVSIN